MKRCPQCNKPYSDDSLKFCLQDGNLLVHEAPRFDAQADTLKFPDSSQPTVKKTKKGWRKILALYIFLLVIGAISLALWQRLLDKRDNSQVKQEQPPSLSENDGTRKVAGISLLSNNADTDTYVDLRLLYYGPYESMKTRVQFLDLAIYSNNKAYIKVSICNIYSTTGKLNELYLWYTSPNGQDSINWHLSPSEESNPLSARVPLVVLKPNECKVVSGWSKELGDSFLFARPFGKIYMSSRQSYPSGSIDLGRADSGGLIQF